MDEPRIIRPSSLTTYLDCPRRFAARHLRMDVVSAGYELNKPLPSTAGAVVGSGVHGGVAYTLDHWREHGTYGLDADAVEKGILEFRERVTLDGVTYDDTTRDANTAEKQITRMTRSYRQEVAPKVQPVLVEERLEADIAAGWVLSGQLDTLASVRAEGQGERIRDVKSGAVRRANGVQYGAYALLFEAHGYKITGLIEDYIARVKITKEQPPPVEIKIELAAAREDAFETMAAVQRDVALFHERLADPNGRPANAAFRPNPGSQLCSAKWCPAHGTAWCRAHKPE